jgi:hypothetical protein
MCLWGGRGVGGNGGSGGERCGNLSSNGNCFPHSSHIFGTHTLPFSQVIKCELFDEAVDRAVKRYPLMLLTTPTQAAAGYR